MASLFLSGSLSRNPVARSLRWEEKRVRLEAATGLADGATDGENIDAERRASRAGELGIAGFCGDTGGRGDRKTRSAVDACRSMLEG